MSFEKVADALLGPNGHSIAHAVLERVARLVDLDQRELCHRLEVQLDAVISRARPAIIAPHAPALSDSVNRDLTEVVRELEEGIDRGDFGRPHWHDDDRNWF